MKNTPANYQSSPFNSAVGISHEDIDGQNQEICCARDLHAALQVAMRFDKWIGRRIKEYGFIERQDFWPILAGSPIGRPSTEYHLTLNMAKELAMVERTDVGRQVRQYFIKAEEHARTALIEQANQVQPIEQVVTRIKDNGKFKYLIILHEQGHKLAKALANESDPGAKYQLHCQLRQVNGALGIPTLPLSESRMATPKELG